LIRIFDITSKDLLQLLRDRKTFLFLLIMPIAFTVLFGFSFGAFNKVGTDLRLPVAFLDQDQSRISKSLHDQLAASEIIRLEEFRGATQTYLENQVASEKLAAAIIVPAGYSHEVLGGKSSKLILFTDTSSTAGMSVESETLSASIRLKNAVQTARIMVQMTANGGSFDYVYDKALSNWQDPPISVTETTASAIKQQDTRIQSLAHTSPGMMLQFAIAGLLTSAEIIVIERKSRCLQRLLTTATARVHILLGHYLAILTLIFCQFLLLISFGQLVLHVNYLSAPGATLLVAFCAAVCVAALGLLIGVLAKTQEQGNIFALILMFLLAGMGGSWVPLEVTGATFRSIGHLSPIAWAMDGFQNISIRGLGIESVVTPSAALLGYAMLFFALATWRFSRAELKP